jgi:hypothetical protein
LLELLDILLRKFNINIRQIINNSDNIFEDIRNEGYIVLYEHYDDIIKDNNVFINELRKKCLRFNKYGKRIDTKSKWEEYNALEDTMNNISNSYTQINEDLLCSMCDIKDLIGEDNYKFLIDYYGLGYKKTAEKYNISSHLSRKRASLLIEKIRKGIGYD